MASRSSLYLQLLKNRINLRQIPFSERGSRLLVFLENNHFNMRLAERWIKLSGKLAAYRSRPPLIDRFTLNDDTGNQLPLEVTTYPDRIEIETPIGVFWLAFLDSETLYLSLPAVKCGITFCALLDQARGDRRGGVLWLTGDIRRNVAYTTNAKILQNEIKSENDIAGNRTPAGCLGRQQGAPIEYYPSPGIQPLDAASLRWCSKKPADAGMTGLQLRHPSLSNTVSNIIMPGG